MSFVDNLTWRRAVKHFATPSATPSATRSAPDITPILSAACEAPTCFGLQPFKVIVVENVEAKARLAPVCYNQPQITECTHLLVFCARNDLEVRLEEYVAAIGASPETKAMIENMLTHLSHPVHWAKHQAYLALGFALAAAAEKKIASCPMEGFDPAGVAAALNLPHTLVPTALLAVGIEDPRPEATPYPRFRFPMSDLVQRVDTASTVAPPRNRYRNATPVRRRKGKTD
jgi:nitroreductase/dihydropteridine reductase